MLQENAATQTTEVRCCIAGGGPAGMVLGFLLARAGVDVVVLEKHKISCVIFEATPSIRPRSN
jgi:2-polyprenyl-6-methoxyphenol hydroxylase-like FAD-dependent oxidoreductase